MTLADSYAFIDPKLAERRQPITAPPRAPAPSASVHHRIRRSLSLVTVAWMFGSVWATTTAGAPITLFAQSLRASKFQFGLLSALPFIASLVSMPASALIERTGARKRIFLWGSYLNRLLWLPIALVPYYLISHNLAGYGAAIWIFLLLVFAMHSAGAVGGPAWVSWMADVVPDRVRGQYFSRRRQWGIVSAIPAALLAGWMLDRLSPGGASASPLMIMHWCCVIFLAATCFGVGDISLFHAVPEETSPPKRISMIEIFSQPLRDPQFLWFGGFVGTLVFAVSFMGQFVTLYLIEKLKVTNTQTQLMLLVGPMIAQLLVLGVWGRVVDRFGKKPSLAIAALGLVPVGLGWCFVSRDHVWLGYLLSALGAALWVGVEVANLNLVLEMAGSNDDDRSDNGGRKRSAGPRRPDARSAKTAQGGASLCPAGENPRAARRSTGGSNYVAVNSVIINIAGCLGGLSSGLIAQHLRDWHFDLSTLGLHDISFYEVLFALSGILRLAAAVIFLPMIIEPTAKPTREAIRYMASNFYNNVFGAVLLPLRTLWVRLRLRETYVMK